MNAAEMGQTVRVHYVGTLNDQSEFDSSRKRGEPLEFTIGLGQVIPGFEDAVVGLTPGENRTVTIIAAQAYGEHHADMVTELPRAELGSNFELTTGMVLSAQDNEGRTLHFAVVSFTDESVTLDGNHPLAGQDLTFAIELVEIL
jgi:FKBP-type peptidyl-prolyl cis-trans isomerase 2